MYFFRTDDDSSDDIMGNTSLLTTVLATTDDRHARHITHDDRFLSAPALRRRLDHLIKEKRWEGGNMVFQDDAVLAIISHAAEERMKCLVEQLRSISQQRASLSVQVYHLTLCQGDKQRISFVNR